MRVVVLMSTFQGEKYVEEQIKSILLQLPPFGRILIRDDGSSDKTTDIIKNFNDTRILLTEGINIGFVRSFLTLISTAPSDAEMYMLSDQDDVWLPEKIQRAWEIIRSSENEPILYCARLKLVSKILEPIGLSPDWPRRPTFENALTENIVTGCTAAMNRRAIELFHCYGDPSKIYFHDWWLYLVVSSFGKVIFDRNPTILYRQHGNNAIGMNQGLMRYLTILRFLRKKNWVHIMFSQMENFKEIYWDILPACQRDFLAQNFNTKNPKAIFRLIFKPRRLRQTLKSDFLFRVILILDIVTGRGLLPKKIQS